MDVTEKKRILVHTIRDRGSMLVAFSGGVDSTLLAVLAKKILGDKSRCVLLDSPVVPRSAVQQAQEIAGDSHNNVADWRDDFGRRYSDRRERPEKASLFLHLIWYTN